MLFVTLARVKSGSTMVQRMQRRVNYKYPDGVKVVGEYWLQTEDPSVILITESDNLTLGFQGMAQWDDVFDVKVFPAMTAEQGLQMAQQIMAGARA